MSYGINLYRKNSTKPFTEDELWAKKLNMAFDIGLIDGDKKRGFEVGYKYDSPFRKFEFYFDTDHYYTSCPYSDYLNVFKQVVKEVSNFLDLTIEDVQISPIKKFEPLDYRVDDPKSIEVIELQKKLLKPQNLRFILPGSSKYFVLYFIVTSNPKDHRYYYLVMEDGRFYAGKVEPGKNLKEIVDKEIVELTGSKVYRVINIKDNYDSAPDKFGNVLPRTSVTLEVSYFDPKIVKTKYPMKWIILEDQNL